MRALFERLSTLMPHGFREVSLRVILMVIMGVVLLFVTAIEGCFGEQLRHRKARSAPKTPLDQQSRAVLKLCVQHAVEGRPKSAVTLLRNRVHELGLYQPAEKFLEVAAQQPELADLSDEISRMQAHIFEIINAAPAQPTNTNNSAADDAAGN